MKVLHPNVVERVHADVAVLRTCLWLGSLVGSEGINTVLNTMDLDGFFGTIVEQADLTTEAENARLLRNNFQRMHHVVKVPRVFYSSSDVLVEEFCEGLPMDRFVKLHPEHSWECHSLLSWVVWKMALQDNFLHADLHRGNILYKLERTAAGKEKVVLSLIDFGLVTHLDEKTYSLVQKYLKNIFIPDDTVLFDLLLSFGSKGSTIDEGEVKDCLSKVIALDCEKRLDKMKEHNVTLKMLSTASDALLERSVPAEGYVKGEVQDVKVLFDALYKQVS